MNALQKERITHLRGTGESYAKIAAALGISINTIKSYCRRNNVGDGSLIAAPKETVDVYYCKQCGGEITQQPRRKIRKFCSDECCAAWWKANPDKLGKKAVYSFACAYCGMGFTAYGNAKRKYCSHACYVAGRFGKGATP